MSSVLGFRRSDFTFSFFRFGLHAFKLRLLCIQFWASGIQTSPCHLHFRFRAFRLRLMSSFLSFKCSDFAFIWIKCSDFIYITFSSIATEKFRHRLLQIRCSNFAFIWIRCSDFIYITYASTVVETFRLHLLHIRCFCVSGVQTLPSYDQMFRLHLYHIH